MEKQQISFNCIMFLTTVAHIFNNVIIFLKRKLHRPEHYILTHLSFCDLLMLLLLSAKLNSSSANEVLQHGISICYTASVLTTLAMTVNKFISVEYCLRYHDIVTTRRLFVSFFCVWISSCVAAAVPFICTSSVVKRKQINDCIMCTLYTTLSLLMVACSLYIRSVRNGHELKIRQRKSYFGATEERLHILQRLSTSVFDIIKLNVATSVIVIIIVVCRVTYKYVFQKNSSAAHSVLLIMNSLYVISNPIVYAVTITDLKQEYKKITKAWYRKCCGPILLAQQRQNEAS